MSYKKNSGKQAISFSSAAAAASPPPRGIPTAWDNTNPVRPVGSTPKPSERSADKAPRDFAAAVAFHNQEKPVDQRDVDFSEVRTSCNNRVDLNDLVCRPTSST